VTELDERWGILLFLKKGMNCHPLLNTPVKEGLMDERDKIVIGALKACITRESIEDTFERYDITDTQEKIDKLNQCMGDPQTFFSSGKVSLEETYELTIQMFLTMSWKLNELYDRMGLVTADV
jgi:hypothetical protein